MAEVLEKTGKTVEDAYRAALAELNVSEDRVTYEVLEEPSKGFFGLIGTKPVVIFLPARRKVLAETLLPLPAPAESNPHAGEKRGAKNPDRCTR